MKKLLLATVFSLASIAASAQCDCPPPGDWRKSWVSGENDLSATEVRQFVVYGDPPSIYIAVGGWKDQTNPKGTAQIFRLDSPDGRWVREVELNSGAGTTTGGLARIDWERTKDYQPVHVSTLVAATWSGANAYVKNPSDGKWYKTSFGDGQVRAFGVHDDKVALEEWVFAGGKPGIFRGQLKDARPAGETPVLWDAQVELNSVNLPGSCSGGGRVMGFAEARGKEFAAICWDIYVRRDGLKSGCQADQVRLGDTCEPRWKRFWSSGLSGGESGLRGLTTVSFEGKQWLLAGSEIAAAKIFRVDPDTADSVVELNVDQSLDNVFGANSGYKIIPYNSPAPLWYGPDGIGRRIFGFESWLPGQPTADFSRKLVNESQLMLGEGMFFVRNAPGSFQLVHIPRSVTPQPMTAIRDCVASPFPGECNAQGQDCVLYCGGFDANKSVTQTPCYAAPCTVPPLEAVPTHNTGFIVKGRIAVPNSATAAADKALVPEGTEGER